ncbi:MAG: ABC transporter ATP-binding protein [Anaerolineaceae bacterium]|nr:ABC transporter ATP-binding protein [Anaerolineaceae bacterium]
MNTIIKVNGLRKTYGAVVAVDNINFNVMEGEIFGMVGPNGAGKTTTIECLEGLRKPDQGDLSVMGVDPNRESQLIKRKTGMQLQDSNLPEHMKVWEALDLYSTFYDKPVDWRKLLNQLGLDEKSDTRFSKLSGGQKQRLFIALALLPDPQLIFLDELTTGLDPQARHVIWDLIREVRSNGKTVVLTTHFMEEAERLCDRVAIIDQGKIVALDTPSTLIRNFGLGERITFCVDGSVPEEFEKDLSNTGRVEKKGNTVKVYGNNKDIPLVLVVANQLAKHKIQFRELRSEQATLEDVFLKLTGKQIRE